MKKAILLITVIAMIAVMSAGCAGKSADSPPLLKTPLEEISNSIIEKNPVEFQGQLTTIDLKDTSEEGKWLAQSTTGLEDFTKVKEAVVYEPSMSSLAFSMVLVRVNDAADAKHTAEAMKAGIDSGKWICAFADEVQVVGYGDVILYIMLDSSLGMKTDNFVKTFQEICNAKPDFKL